MNSHKRRKIAAIKHNERYELRNRLMKLYAAVRPYISRKTEVRFMLSDKNDLKVIMLWTNYFQELTLKQKLEAQR